MCASWEWLLCGRETALGRARMEPNSDWLSAGEAKGESGSGVSSGGVALKGPSRGLAGETGRLPGIGSSLVLVDLEEITVSC